MAKVLQYFLFSNSTHESETASANRWETTNNNPHGPIKLSSQSETRSIQVSHISLPVNRWETTNNNPHRPIKLSSQSETRSIQVSHISLPVNRWETTNNNPHGPIKLSSQSETRSIQVSHISLPVNPLDLSAVPHQGFLVQSHILSMSRDALRTCLAA